MDNIKRVLAFDFGASSGRAVLGLFDGEKIEIKEIKRFENSPVYVNGTLYWDVLRLLYEIKESIVLSKQYGKIDSIGIDTWGVDFGLLDKNGDLVTNPVHYRDERTKGVPEQFYSKMSRDELYKSTGIQIMELNTLFQLIALKDNRPDILERVDSLLLMPDLFNYFLTGVKKSEETIVSTTQMYDPIAGTWNKKVLDKVGLPNILSEIVKSGTVVGKTTAELNDELEIEPIDVIAVCGHDTQSAIVSVPTDEEDFIFLSCGTWSLLGTEIDKPILNEMAMEYNITNEKSFGDKISFLKNITGLFILNECKKQWDREGKHLSFSELSRLSTHYEHFDSILDPDDVMFSEIGNMPKKIRAYMKKTNQKEPTEVGEYVRCIYESLSITYKNALEEIEKCTNKTYNTIHMVGGGSKSDEFCQIIANRTGKQVVSGPSEATVYGNVVVQLMSKGFIKDIAHARRIIKSSEKIKVYSKK